eukprot:TRINITY_DN152_c0_g1::TRINITY_DN152_c0_g1_i1::g.14386::m.14386 TRINITY_DN152_c0_g1::TRINITY_DN152_c0_g1_i1::g.14386  ORF type:complete len:149 (-),score=12.88,NADH-u_ox-rdase/PF10785.4/1.4e-06 TRINITY_DN152_c0_g1_i1:5-421(-)
MADGAYKPHPPQPWPGHGMDIHLRVFNPGFFQIPYHPVILEDPSLKLILSSLRLSDHLIACGLGATIFVNGFVNGTPRKKLLQATCKGLSALAVGYWWRSYNVVQRFNGFYENSREVAKYGAIYYPKTKRIEYYDPTK